MAAPGEKATSYRRRARLRRIAILLILLLLLCLLGYFFYSFYRNKQVPLPDVSQVPTGEIPPPRYLFSITGGDGSHALTRPLDVRVNPTNGLIYVTDSGNSRVEVFDYDGNFQFEFKDIDGGRTLNRPVYLAFDSKGNVFVSDRNYNDIFVFTARGKFIKKFVINKDPNFEYNPTAITIDDKNRVYVTDNRYQHRLLILDKNGKLIRTIGKTGEADRMDQLKGRFLFPNGVVIDDKDLIYVADSNNRRIQVFDFEGKLIRILETSGLPRGVDFDYKQRLVVADSLGHDGRVFTKTGTTLTTFGERGFDYGQFQYPNGLHTGPGRRIYVTDRENHRVQVWAWPIEPPRQLRELAARLCPFWWVLLLPLLPIWLWLRRKKFLAHDDFLEIVIEEGKVELLADKIKKVWVTEETFEKFKDVEQDDIKMEDIMKIKDYYDDLVEEFKEEYDLEENAATLLSGAKKGINKVMIFAEDIRLRDAAEDLEMPNMNYIEFLEKYSDLPPDEGEGPEGAPKPPEEPPPQEARCQAYTRSGEQCRNKTVPGFNYCQIHLEKPSDEDEAKPRLMADESREPEKEEEAPETDTEETGQEKPEESSTGRCQAITTYGDQCRFPARPGSKYCGIHQSWEKKDSS